MALLADLRLEERWPASGDEERSILAAEFASSIRTMLPKGDPAGCEPALRSLQTMLTTVPAAWEALEAASLDVVGELLSRVPVAASDPSRASAALELLEACADRLSAREMHCAITEGWSSVPRAARPSLLPSLRKVLLRVPSRRARFYEECFPLVAGLLEGGGGREDEEGEEEESEESNAADPAVRAEAEWPPPSPAVRHYHTFQDSALPPALPPASRPATSRPPFLVPPHLLTFWRLLPPLASLPPSRPPARLPLPSSLRFLVAPAPSDAFFRCRAKAAAGFVFAFLGPLAAEAGKQPYRGHPITDAERGAEEERQWVAGLALRAAAAAGEAGPARELLKAAGLPALALCRWPERRRAGAAAQARRKSLSEMEGPEEQGGYEAGAGAGAAASDGSGDGDGGEGGPLRARRPPRAAPPGPESHFFSELGAALVARSLLLDPSPLPDVLAPGYRFCLAAPHALALLRAGRGGMAVDLIESELKRVPPRSLRPPAGVSGSGLLALIQALLDHTVAIADPRERSRAFAVSTGVLSALRDGPRFVALRDLLASVPYPALHGLLINRLKDEIREAWPSPRTPHDPSESSPFASDRVLPLLRAVLDPRLCDVDAAHDVAMAALNLYRFVLLRELGEGRASGGPEGGVTGSLRPGELRRARDRFLRPLRDIVDARARAPPLPPNIKNSNILTFF
eukprot:tig00020563_g11305.t1